LDGRSDRRAAWLIRKSAGKPERSLAQDVIAAAAAPQSAMPAIFKNRKKDRRPMSQARVARIAGISLASLWLATALLAAAAVEHGEVAAVPAPVVTANTAGAS
jgi:hypothetical protein